MTKQTMNATKKAMTINRLKSALVWMLMLTLVWNSTVIQAADNSSRSRRASKPAKKSAPPAAAVQGQTMVVWGPQQVVRQPINTTYYASFSLPSGAIPPYQMTVSNGSTSGTNKVTQACIKLNGVNVLSPTCYHSVNPTPQIRTVSLQANNNIEVSLVGPSLSYITITVTANQASLAVSPTSGNQGQTMVVNLTGTGTNWVAGQTTASFGGEITVDWVNVTSATAATAQITISATAALGRQVIVEYDPVGNVTAQTDRIGRRTTISYDNINRPTTVTFVDATVTYQYDAAGRWNSVSDASGTITWQYDNANRITAEITNLGTVNYGYNNANQRSLMTAADRPPVNYGYDNFGRLQTISQTTGSVTELFTYGYDTLSRRTQLQRQSNGAGIVTTDYQYDEISRLTRLKHTRVSTGTLHEDLQYEYNLDDEITKITSLASAPLTPLSKTATTADAANRIPQFGTASYSFNQEGQTTAKTDASGTTNYQWDSRGRLTRVTLPSGQVVDYSYDAVGRRVNRVASGVSTTFQYDGPDVVVDRVSGGSAYDYLNGLSVDDKLRQNGGNGGTIYFLQNHLNNTVGLVDISGGFVEPSQQYEAFGTGAGSIRTRYGYTGRERDELTGLMYYRARYYNPDMQRFISEDPIGFAGRDPNLYAYVLNSPSNFFDPTGLDAWTSFLGGVRVVGGGFETAAGVGLAVTTGWTGVGAVAGGAVGLPGLDQIQAGLRQLISGCSVDSLTSNGLQAAGLSRSTANLADAGISVVGSLGTGAATQAIKAGGAQNIIYYEIGQQTLSPSSYAKYGQIADPAKRGMQMVEDLGWRKALTPELGGVPQFSKTIPKGPTPLGGAGVGALGGAATSLSGCGCED